MKKIRQAMGLPSLEVSKMKHVFNKMNRVSIRMKINKLGRRIYYYPSH